MEEFEKEDYSVQFHSMSAFSVLTFGEHQVLIVAFDCFLLVSEA